MAYLWEYKNQVGTTYNRQYKERDIKMSKKLVVLAFLAYSILGVSNAYALDCEHDNKVSMNPATQVCCCKEDRTDHYICKPMTDKGDKKCPGTQQAAGDELYTKKVSTQTNDTCVCQFTIQH